MEKINVMLSLRGVRRTTWQSVFLVLLVLISACSGMSRTARIQYPGEVSTEMQQEFNQIEVHYRSRNYDYAFAGYQHYIDSYVYNRLTDESYYKQGKIFFLGARFADAVNKFNSLANKTPNITYQQKALHMVAYAYYKMDRFEDVVKYLREIKHRVLPVELRIQSYSLAVLSAQKSAAVSDFGNYCKFRLLDTYEEHAGENLKELSGRDVISYSEAQTMVESWVDAALTSDQMPSWIRTYPQGPAKAYLDYKVGLSYMQEKQYKKARRSFSKFVRYYPKHKYAPAARKYLAELGGVVNETTDAKGDYKIGLVLPLSGNLESYGMSVLDGVRCGVGDKNVCGAFSGIELVVRDSGTTPASTRVAVESLIQEKVAAIIGPLSGSLAVEAGLIASQYKIPVFPITQYEGLMSQGKYIYQVGFPPKKQIESLVREALSRGYRSFGVFYPDNNYGKTLSELFILEVKNQGGKITAEAQYRRSSPDIYSEVRKLKQSIGRLAAPSGSMGFDALFIPDSYQVINLVVPALEFNSIKGVPLLGTNAWNDPGLTLSLVKNFPGSFFVDLYDSRSGSKRVSDFQQMFSQGFGRQPRVLEAFGYDIAKMIRAIAASRGAQGIQDTLERHYFFEGVTGLKGFEAGVDPVVESHVLNIKAEGIVD